jgi:hypothetical protein
MASTKKHPAQLKSAILFLMVVIFLLAVVWSLFKYYDVWFGRVKYGFRIQPPFAISLLKLRNGRGELLRNDRGSRHRRLSARLGTNGKWLMLYFHPGVCHQGCQKALHNLRHIREALDQNKQRVQRGILTYPNLANEIGIHMMIEQRYPGTRHFTVSKSRLRRIIEKQVMIHYALMPGALYIVDPKGDFVLCFKPNEKPSQVYHDINVLLNLSEIG